MNWLRWRKYKIGLFGIFLSTFSMAQTNSIPNISWREAGVLPVTSQAQPHMGLSGFISGFIGDKCILAGGNNFPMGLPWEGGAKKYYKDVFIYDIKKDTLVVNPTFKFSLPSKVAYAAVAQLKDGIFYAGGENETGPVNHVYCIKKSADANRFEIIKWPNLPEAVTNAVAMATNNAVYVFGGACKEGVSDKVWALYFNQIKAGWKFVSTMPQPTAFAASALLRNQIYVIGGRCKGKDGISKMYKQVYAWNIASNTWFEKAELPETLSASTALCIGDAEFLLIGGDNMSIFHEVELLTAKISSSADTTVIRELTTQKNNLQKNHLGFSKDVLRYQAIPNRWELISHMKFLVPVTTHAFKWNNRLFLPAGEIKPGIRTHKIWVGLVNK